MRDKETNMHPEEMVAFSFLKTLFGEEPDFEPDREIPPDFAYGKELGIEVRRLNQNYFGDAEPIGLENMNNVIQEIFEEILRSFDSNYIGSSYYVTISYKREPALNFKAFKKSIKNSLQQFLKGNMELPAKLKVNSFIWLDLFPSPPINEKLFVSSFLRNDFDLGGFFIPVYKNNIEFCIKDKAKTVNPHLNKYRKWWLILVDYIQFPLRQEHISELISTIVKPIIFDKIIILNSSDRQRLIQWD